MGRKDGLILTFDVTNKKTLLGLKSFYSQLCEVYYDQQIPPIVLCGNKIDREDREVSYSQAKQLADKWNCCSYIEVSAKTGYNINYLYSTIIRHIIAPKIQLKMLRMANECKKKCCVM